MSTTIQRQDLTRSCVVVVFATIAGLSAGYALSSLVDSWMATAALTLVSAVGECCRQLRAFDLRLATVVAGATVVLFLSAGACALSPHAAIPAVILGVAIDRLPSCLSCGFTSAASAVMAALFVFRGWAFENPIVIVAALVAGFVAGRYWATIDPRDRAKRI